MIRLTRFTALLFLLFLSWSVALRADVVSDWNDIATQLTVPARPGPSSLLDLAMVHVAMHDAIQAYEGRFETYTGAIPNASGSPIAAAAAAAHDVLVARLPAQGANLDALLTTYLGNHNLLADPGVGVGQVAAAAIVSRRFGDGSFPQNPEVFVGGTKPGEWRPTLPAFAPMATPWLGSVIPFALKASSQLRASPPPPHLTSGQYARDYNEVKSLGRLNSTERTPAQTALALFYSDNFITMWQRTLRGVAAAKLTSVGDRARLFALANIAGADAAISAWDNKKYWNFWRPITAIQEGNNDGNDKTTGDPTWLPQIPTPPYSDYTSGANTLTAAVMGILERLFGDRTTFVVFSTTSNTTKTYYRFSDVCDDVVNVRVYQGIHFRSADEVARRLGTTLANRIFSQFLRPQ